MMERRNTVSKKAVMEVLSGSKKAMSQDAIERLLKVDIDRATIYRILNRSCTDGILHKIVADDGKQYFAMGRNSGEAMPPKDHFHFRCTDCHTIECLPVSVEYSLQKSYQVERVNCILIGRCSECQTA